MSFALDLQKFSEKTKEKADVMVESVVMGVATEIDQRSPVGDGAYWISKPPKGYIGGRFRANWQLGIGVMPTGTTDQVDPNGTISLPAIIANIPEQAAGHIYYLANNLPYAQRIEEGHSRQAPQGIVGLTTIRFQQIVNDAVGSLS